MHIPWVILAAGLWLGLLVGAALAQPVDRERVRVMLSFYGLTCDDVRKASKAKRLYWSIKAGLDAEQRRQVHVTCGLK